jgi:hypothetical protein
MPSRRDLEDGSTLPDERAPLLRPEAARHDTDASPESDVSSEEPSKATSRTWYYVWRGVLIVFAILVIAVFIKGWIEADDVDVINTNPPPRFLKLIRCNSLISKAH